MFKLFVLIFITAVLIILKLLQRILCSNHKLKQISEAERKAHDNLDNETEEEYNYRLSLIREKERLFDTYFKITFICNILIVLDFTLLILFTL